MDGLGQGEQAPKGCIHKNCELVEQVSAPPNLQQALIDLISEMFAHHGTPVSEMGGIVILELGFSLIKPYLA